MPRRICGPSPLQLAGRVTMTPLRSIPRTDRMGGIGMKRSTRLLQYLALGLFAIGISVPVWAARFSFARIYIEYNASANDLGYHVTLDGENWKTLKIINPVGKTIFDVVGRGPYNDLGMTELFFEGAEPSLDEFPLGDLLALFPEGKYKFAGLTVGGAPITSNGTLTHAVPAGPVVSTEVDGDTVVIRWEAVTGPPAGFPNRRIDIVRYQVIVGLGDPFQVTLPATSREVTLPRELVASLKPGVHPFEVLAIEVGGNQTLTEGTVEIQ